MIFHHSEKNGPIDKITAKRTLASDISLPQIKMVTLTLSLVRPL